MPHCKITKACLSTCARRRALGLAHPSSFRACNWVRPEMVVEVTYLTWTDDNLLRHVVFNGVREDKPARDVVRPIPHPEKVPAPQERAAAPRSRRMTRT